jgi:hypothetical protein
MERTPVQSLLELAFWLTHFSCTVLSLSPKNRIAEFLVDDIVYYDIVEYYAELFNDMRVRPCTDSSSIGWRSGQGGG